MSEIMIACSSVTCSGSLTAVALACAILGRTWPAARRTVPWAAIRGEGSRSLRPVGVGVVALSVEAPAAKHTVPTGNGPRDHDPISDVQVPYVPPDLLDNP